MLAEAISNKEAKGTTVITARMRFSYVITASHRARYWMTFA